MVIYGSHDHLIPNWILILEHDWLIFSLIPFAIGANFPASFSIASTSAANLLLWIRIPFQAHAILAN